jgi:hypothetical protein
VEPATIVITKEQNLVMAEEKFQIEKYITKMLEQCNVRIRSKHDFSIEINKILTITDVTALPPLFD